MPSSPRVAEAFLLRSRYIPTGPNPPTAMYVSVQPRATDAARMIRQSLDAYFEGECSEVPEVDLLIADVDLSPAPDDASCTLTLRVGQARQDRAHFTVQHVGGNVYDVRGGLEGETQRAFTCCLPDTGSIPVAPSVGRAIGSFLARELERVVGSKRLHRDADRPSAKPADNRRETDRPPASEPYR